MLNYTIRRLVLAIPTLLFISLVIFLLLDLAPGDPVSNMPLTIPPEVRERIRESLGLGEPVYVRYVKWLGNFFITEPMYLIDHWFGTNLRMTDFVDAVVAVSPGNTGNGTLMVAAPAAGTAGSYALTALAGTDGPDGPAFEVRGPDGKTLGEVRVGQPLEGSIGFELKQGDTAFVPGDGFTVEVTEGTRPRQRILSFQSRSPVMDIVLERMPQTLKVVGIAYLVGVLIALPIGIISAYRQYSWFDQLGTFISMIGFSVPTFFTGVLLIIIFSVKLQWFPSIYDTTLKVVDWPSFVKQVKQMAMPVAVLALFNASQISRFMRASMLDNLHQDYVRTARAKGLTERVVVLLHVLRNSMIPVITVIALGVPTIFGGAIITEQVFKVNGLGQQLILSIQGSDIPMVQTLTFIFAVLIVLFNLIADVLYGMLDPRIRYD
ncbi:ABC transporter permease [Frigidibacter sp. ROC022]|uniref:ABC transporter permease n=1 Tax=Frigidibacter sp. ROC022 TaxID=2971796 RepID=UPI00215B1002|nr:ABC transporter permease [Frigidibacter sp. ROC022]MCR8726294.1 ABC transporter permease [Frigidibacter sp. ROC022]